MALIKDQHVFLYFRFIVRRNSIIYFVVGNVFLNNKVPVVTLLIVSASTVLYL